MNDQPKDWRDLPEDAHLAIRRTIHFLRYAANEIGEANLEIDREGWAIDFDSVADNLDTVLGKYGLPSDCQLPWIDAGETEAEAIERELLKRG